MCKYKVPIQKNTGQTTDNHIYFCSQTWKIWWDITAVVRKSHAIKAFSYALRLTTSVAERNSEPSGRNSKSWTCPSVPLYWLVALLQRRSQPIICDVKHPLMNELLSVGWNSTAVTNPGWRKEATSFPNKQYSNATALAGLTVQPYFLGTTSHWKI